MATWYNLADIGEALADGDKLLIHNLSSGTDSTVEFSRIKDTILEGQALGTTTALTQIQVDNINLNANTISTTNTNGNLTLTPNGTGNVVVTGNLAVDTNTLYVDAVNDRVRINTTTNYQHEFSVEGDIYLAGKAGDVASDLVLRNTGSNGATDQSEIIFRGTDSVTTRDTAIIGTTNIQSFGRGDLFFATKSTSDNARAVERLRITSGGNLLVGTTSDNGAKAQIAGNLNVSGGGEFGGTISSGYSDTDGEVLIQSRVFNIANRNLTTIGTNRSTGYPVIGAGVRPSNTTVNEFLSTTTVNFRRSALTFQQSSTKALSLYTTGGSTVTTAVGSQVTEMTEVFSVSPTGDLTVSGGIYLGGTAAANLLDDYEEGTWTPTVYGSTTGSGDPHTINSVFATYTKIGSEVSLKGYFVISALSPTATGTLLISGTPFTASSSANITEGAISTHQVSYRAGSSITIRLENNDTTLTIIESLSGSGVTTASITDVAVGSIISFQINYTTQ